MHVLGHLAKPSAKKFWEEQVLATEAGHLPGGVDPPDFEAVFGICGGSMFLMKDLMMEYKLDEWVHKNSGIVLQQLRKLQRALEPIKTYPELCPLQWDKAQLLKVMAMLTILCYQCSSTY